MLSQHYCKYNNGNKPAYRTQPSQAKAFGISMEAKTIYLMANEKCFFTHATFWSVCASMYCELKQMNSEVGFSIGCVGVKI